MNTPSHIILNLAMLGRRSDPQLNGPIAVGALLPDLPIFLFYAWAKGIARLPDQSIWSTVYFESGWQTVFALSHSIPLALVGWAIAAQMASRRGRALFGSMVLHSLLDLPVHHDDAHRHFYPLSHYRFISPVSYWDRDHYGAVVALVELALVAIATGVLLRRSQAPPFWHAQPHWGTGLLLATNAFYAVGYIGLYAAHP